MNPISSHTLQLSIVAAAVLSVPSLCASTDSSAVGRRIYISGDTDGPEVLTLAGVDPAFLAISRWALTPERGSAIVRSLMPTVADPDHVESSAARHAFARLGARRERSHRAILREWNR